MVTKRLGNEERGAVVPGSVYIWEERGVDGTLGGRFVTRLTPCSTSGSYWPRY